MNKPSNNFSPVTINHISENAILIEWPQIICEKQHQHIMLCQKQIQNTLLNGLIDSIASYASLIIYYDINPIQPIIFNENAPSIEIIIRDIVEKNYVNLALEASAQTVIEIPVYYGESAGWDIKYVAQRANLSIDEVIKKHTQTTYRAYALGFTPGFCYLGQLPKALQLSRKESPRINVPKGAVAIAEQQTAVYPNNSPGGWHILGQTPMPMLISSKNTESTHAQFSTVINVGQQVRFSSITRKEFLTLGGTLELNTTLGALK